MRIARAVPALRARPGADREVMTSIVRRARDRGHRLHVVTVAALVRAPPRSSRSGRRPGSGRPPRGRRRGAASPGVHPFPTDKTNIPARALAFGGFTALTAPTGAADPQPARRGARHVAAAHARPGRLGGGAGPRRAVRVQHPGRLPRRRGRGRARSTTRRVIAAARGSSGPPTGAPTPSPSCPTTCATTWRPSSPAPAPTPARSGSSRTSSTPTGSARARRTTPTAASTASTGKTGRDVRRQPRLLPVGRAAARRGPRPASTTRGRVRGQRRRSARPGLERRAAGLDNVRFVDLQPATGCRGPGRRRRPRRAARARAWPAPASPRSCTRSSPPAAPSWPASTRAPRWPAPSSGPAPAWRAAGRRRRASPRRSTGCSRTPTRPAVGPGRPGLRRGLGLTGRGGRRRTRPFHRAGGDRSRRGPARPDHGAGAGPGRIEPGGQPMGKASSAKKVARAARAGGRRHRPASRNSASRSPSPPSSSSACCSSPSPARATRPPRTRRTAPKRGEHWHAAYGIFICDRFVTNVADKGQDDPLGIHTHEDGLVHIHPFSNAAAGKQATWASSSTRSG